MTTSYKTGIHVEARASGLGDLNKLKTSIGGVNTSAVALQGGLNLINKGTRTLGSAVKTLAGPLALGAVVTGFKSAVSSAITYGDVLDKASQRTNVNAQTLDNWYRSANLADVSQQRINKSLVQLNAKLKNATDNTDSLIINNSRLTVNSSAVSDAFKDLGVNVLDSTGHLKTNDTVMREIADSIQRLGVNSQTTSDLITIFGRRGASELIPFFKQGSEGMDRFNARIGPDFDKNSALFDDNMVLLGGMFRDLNTSITDKLLPGLIKFQEYLLNSEKNFAPIIRGTLKAIDVLKAFLGPILVRGGKQFAILGNAIKSNLVKAIDTVKSNWENWKPRIADVIVIVTSLIEKIKGELSEAIRNARERWNKWKPRISEVIVIVTSLIEKIRNNLSQAIENTRNRFGLWIPEVKNSNNEITILRDTIKNDLSSSIEFVRDKLNSWKPQIDIIIDGIFSLEDKIKNNLSKAIDSVVNYWKTFTPQIEIITDQVLVLGDKIKNDLSLAIDFARNKWELMKPPIDTIIDSLSNKLIPLIKSDLSLAIDFVSGTWDQFNNNVEGLGKLVKDVLVPSISSDLSLAIDFVSGTWDQFVNNVSGLSKLVKDVLVPSISSDLSLAIDFVSGTWDQFVNNLKGLDALIENIIIPGIRSDLVLAIDFVRDTWDNFNNIVSNSDQIYSEISNTLKSSFNSAIDIIKKEWNKTFSSIKNTIDDLSEVIIDLPNKALKGWENLANKIRSTVGRAIEDISRPLREIGSFLGISGGGGGIFNRNNNSSSGGNKGPLSALGIPGFASGGVVNRPTLATIGEEGPEAIIPLKNLFSGRGGSSGFSGGGLISGLKEALQYVTELRINVDVLKKDINQIGKSFGNAFKGVSSTVGSAVDSVFQLATGIGLLSTAFRIGLFAIFIKFRQQLVPLLLEGINLTIDAVGRLSEGFNVATTFIQNLPIHISNARTRFIELYNSINPFPQITTILGNAIGGLAKGLGTTLISGIRSAINGFRQLWNTIGKDSLSVISSGLNNILKLTRAIDGFLVNAIKIGISSLKNLGTAIVNGLGNVIKIGLDNITKLSNFISKHIPSSITEAITSIKNLGVSLVSDLGNNIKIGIDNLSEISKVVASKLGDAIKIGIEKIKNLGENVGPFLRKRLRKTSDFIKDKFVVSLDKLKGGIEFVRTSFNKLKNLLSGAFSSIFDKVLDSVKALDDVLNTQFAQNIRNTLKIFGLAKDETESFDTGLDQLALLLTQTYNPAITDLGKRYAQASIEIKKAEQSTKDYIKTNQLSSGQVKSKVIPSTKEYKKELKETKNEIIDLTKNQDNLNSKTNKTFNDIESNVKKSLDTVQSELKETKINTEAVSTSFDNTNSKIESTSNSIQTSLGKISKLFKTNTIETDKNSKAIEKNRNELTSIEPPIRKVRSALQKLFSNGFKPLTNEIPKVNKNLDNTEKKLKRIPPAANRAQKGFRGLIQTSGRLVKGIGKLVATVPGLNLLVGGFLAFRVVTTITRWFNNLLTKTSELNKEIVSMRSETGLTASTLLQFSNSARSLGLELSDASTLIGGWNDSILDLQSGNEDLIDIFDKMGISIKDASGNFRDSEDILFDYAQAVSNSSDKISIAALNTEIFGESSSDLDMILSDLAETGKVYNGSIEKSTDLQEQLAERTSTVSRAFESLGNVLFNTFAPAIIQTIDLAGKAINKLKDLFGVERNLTNTEIFARLNKVTSDYFDAQADLARAEEANDNAAIMRSKAKITRLKTESALLKSQLKFLDDNEKKTTDLSAAAATLNDENKKRISDLEKAEKKRLAEITKDEERRYKKLYDDRRKLDEIFYTNSKKLAHDYSEFLNQEAEGTSKNRERLNNELDVKLRQLDSGRYDSIIGHIDRTTIHGLTEGIALIDKLNNHEETKAKQTQDAINFLRNEGFAAAEAEYIRLADVEVAKAKEANDAIIAEQKRRTDALRSDLTGAISGLIKGTETWGSALEKIKNGILNRIIDKISGNAADSILSAFGFASDANNNGFKSLADGLPNLFQGFFQFLINGFKGVGQFASNLFSGISGNRGGGISGGDIFSLGKDLIGGLDFGGGGYDFGINFGGIDLNKKLREGDFGGFDFGFFQDGGVVKKPTIGVIGEGGNAEAVIPLKNGSVPIDFRGFSNDEIIKLLQYLLKTQQQELKIIKKSSSRDGGYIPIAPGSQTVGSGIDTSGVPLKESRIANVFGKHIGGFLRSTGIPIVSTFGKAVQVEAHNNLIKIAEDAGKITSEQAQKAMKTIDGTAETFRVAGQFIGGPFMIAGEIGARAVENLGNKSLDGERKLDVFGATVSVGSDVIKNMIPGVKQTEAVMGLLSRGVKYDVDPSLTNFSQTTKLSTTDISSLGTFSQGASSDLGQLGTSSISSSSDISSLGSFSQTASSSINAMTQAANNFAASARYSGPGGYGGSSGRGTGGGGNSRSGSSGGSRSRLSGHRSSSDVGRGTSSSEHDAIRRANGGIVRKTPGGELSLIGEGRFNEAVVPLPNGRAIPIEFPKNYNDKPNVNVTFNINIDQNGEVTNTNTISDSSIDIERLKQPMIDLILEQTQPGGVLAS